MLNTLARWCVAQLKNVFSNNIVVLLFVAFFLFALAPSPPVSFTFSHFMYPKCRFVPSGALAVRSIRVHHVNMANTHERSRRQQRQHRMHTMAMALCVCNHVFRCAHTPKNRKWYSERWQQALSAKETRYSSVSPTMLLNLCFYGFAEYAHLCI